MKFTDPNVRPAALDVIENNIPEMLRLIPHWVDWDYEWDTDKGYWDKPPRNARTGNYAKTNDPKTWVPFDETNSISRDGVGFVLLLSLGLVGVDLDNCRDPKTGVINDFAKKVIATLNTYTEISPSGTGARLICRGEIPDALKTKVIELYSTGRYLTMTGHHLEGTPNAIQDRTQEILALHTAEAKNRVGKKPGDGETATAPPPPIDRSLPTPEDLALIEKAKQAHGHGQKTADLLIGKFEAYYGDDWSGADDYLCKRLAFWFAKDPARMDRVFRTSGLMRGKWDEKHAADGRTYGQLTIQHAIEETPDTDVYTPRQTNPSQPHHNLKPQIASPKPARVLPIGRKAKDLSDTPVECIVEGLVPRGWFGLLAGADSMGKTLLAMEIAKSVLREEPLFGHFEAHRGKVIAVFLDDPENLTRDRLKSLGLLDEDNLTIFTQDDFKGLSPQEVIATIEAIALRDKPDLLIVDALYKFIPGGGVGDQGNSSSAMAPVMAAFNRISESAKITVMLLAHDNRSGQDVAGSYVVRAEPKFILRLALPPGARESKDGDDRLTSERVFELNKLKITDKCSWRLRLDGPGQWVFHGGSRDAKISELAEHVVLYLQECLGEARSVNEIVSALRRRTFDVRKACYQLWNDGRIQREDTKTASGQIMPKYLIPISPGGGPAGGPTSAQQTPATPFPVPGPVPPGNSNPKVVPKVVPKTGNDLSRGRSSLGSHTCEREEKGCSPDILHKDPPEIASARLFPELGTTLGTTLDKSVDNSASQPTPSASLSPEPDGMFERWEAEVGGHSAATSPGSLNPDDPTSDLEAGA